MGVCVIVACESDDKKLARLEQEAKAYCQGLQDMRVQFDSAFGFWMIQNPDTLMPVMGAYGDSLKFWYDRCELGVRAYNGFRQEAGVVAEEMTMPVPP